MNSNTQQSHLIVKLFTFVFFFVLFSRNIYSIKLVHIYYKLINS